MYSAGRQFSGGAGIPGILLFKIKSGYHQREHKPLEISLETGLDIRREALLPQFPQF
jgi:hypothetical protein